jgi:hypothetical protein
MTTEVLVLIVTLTDTIDLVMGPLGIWILTGTVDIMGIRVIGIDLLQCPSPRLSSVLESQLFRMELALSWVARDWHCGFRGLVADGTRELTEDDLQALHVPLDTRLSVIDTHFKIMSPYSRYDSHFRPGPNLGGARKYTGWQKLTTLAVNAFVEFYGRLTGYCTSFDISLTPFAGIVLRYDHDGLCLPGLGVTIAYEHARALWSLLSKLLLDKAVIQAQVDLTHQEQHGYKLLWQVGSVCLDIFDLVRAVEEPCWSDNDNIFSFAMRTKTY